MYGYVVILSNPIDSLAMNEITYVYITLLGLLYSQALTTVNNVRLKDGAASFKGRLEIKYNGEWGTVCNKNFKAEIVVCHELGFPDAEQISSFHSGPAGGRIWLVDVQCSGNEQSIFDCSHSGWGNTSNCTHEDDIGIICSNNEGSVVVEDISIGTEFIVGRLQIYYEYVFGYIRKTDSWNENNAEVVCRQLGYYTGGSFTTCPTCDPLPCTEFSPPIWNVSLNCNGNETHLLHCNYNTWMSSQCVTSFDAAGVTCARTVQGGWSGWNTNVKCSSPCIDGVAQFTRSCSKPTPMFGGEDCVGNSTNTVKCGSSTCAKPNVTKISSNQEVISNNAATFHCNATAKPIATFYWLKDGVELSNITRSQVNITYSTDGSNCNDSDPPEQSAGSSKDQILFGIAIGSISFIGLVLLPYLLVYTVHRLYYKNNSSTGQNEKTVVTPLAKISNFKDIILFLLVHGQPHSSSSDELTESVSSDTVPAIPAQTTPEDIISTTPITSGNYSTSAPVANDSSSTPTNQVTTYSASVPTKQATSLENNGLPLKVSTDGTNESLLQIIYSLFPKMQAMINMNELYAYLVAYKLLAQIESEKLGPQSKDTPTEKNQYFLSLLESKGPQGQEKFVKALYRTKYLDSHHQLLTLLSSKGVTVARDYNSLQHV